MQTPWGEIDVSDAHVHFFSHRFFSMLAAQRRDGSTAASVGEILGWEMPPEDPGELARRWVEELDRCGVARTALIASLPGDEDSVGAAVSAYPSRFYGYFMVDPCAPDALARVEKALDSGHLQGICLFPAMHRYSVQDERADLVLRAAASRPGTVVFVHCGVLTVGVRGKLGLPSFFDLKFSNPVNLHAVALRFPALNFVIPHFGAGYLRETLMLCDLCPNVYLDTSSSNRWLRYMAGAVDLKQVYRSALEVAGPQRLLFGTDSSYFPRGWQIEVLETQFHILQEIGAGEEAARAIFGGNLARLFSGPQQA